MSRTKPQSGGSSSPIKHRFSFSGGTGQIKYYDKSKSEDVFLDELEFVILDKRSSVTGWNDNDNSSIYSNLVTSIKNEELVIKTSKRTLASGFYADLKAKLDNFGGKFTTNLLVMTKIDGEWAIGNLQLTGSSLGVWMDVESSKTNIYDQIFTITAGEKRKKGSVKFVVPEFEQKKITNALSEKAEELDEILQAYFDGATTPVQGKDVGEEEEEEIPAPKRAPKKEETPKSRTNKQPEPEEEEEDGGEDLPF